MKRLERSDVVRALNEAVYHEINATDISSTSIKK